MAVEVPDTNPQKPHRGKHQEPQAHLCGIVPAFQGESEAPPSPAHSSMDLEELNSEMASHKDQDDLPTTYVVNKSCPEERELERLRVPEGQGPRVVRNMSTCSASSATSDAALQSRKRRMSVDCFVDLLRADELGVAFCTRVAHKHQQRGGHFLRRQTFRLKRLQRSFSMFTQVCPDSGDPMTAALDSDDSVSNVTRLRGLRNWFSSFMTPRRLDRTLKCMAVISCGYVLLGLAVEPSCIPLAAGSTLQRFGVSSWFATSALALLHALSTVVYSVLALKERIFHWRTPHKSIVGDLTLPEEDSSRPWQSPGLWLEIVALGGLLAEFVHLVEAPRGQPTPAQWTMLLQLVKCWRFVLPGMQLHTDQDGLLWGFARVLCSLVMFAHVMSCCLLVIGYHEFSMGKKSWIDGFAGPDNSSCVELYLEAWYFAVLSLTSVGYGDALVTSLERAVNSFFLLLSQLYTAKVCADLTWITSTHNHWEAQHQAQRAQSWVALQRMQVPREVAERVLAFQSYIAMVHREDLTQPAFQGLNDNLMMELRLCAYRKLVLRAPFLREQPRHVMAFIVGSLNDCVYLPGDLIVRSGDTGRELFFMRRGSAQVYVGAEAPVWGVAEPVASYDVGNYFGELGMLTGHPRKAWIMAESYSVCSVLPYSAVQELTHQYPGSFTSLVQAMVKQYQLRANLSWEQISERLEDKYGFDSLEAAFTWFCSHQGTSAEYDEDELTAGGFDEGLRRVKVPPLDRKILWAQLDEDNSGTVTIQEFKHKFYFGEGRRSSTCRGSEDSGDRSPLVPAQVVKAPPPEEEPEFEVPAIMMHRLSCVSRSTRNCHQRWSTLGLRAESDAEVARNDSSSTGETVAVRAADREICEALMEVRQELAKSREQSRKVSEEVRSLRTSTMMKSGDFPLPGMMDSIPDSGRPSPTPRQEPEPKRSSLMKGMSVTRQLSCQ